MQQYSRTFIFVTAAFVTSHVQADVIITLFQTGDTLKSSTFSVLPGEVLSIDAEITSTTAFGDDLNAYLAEFTSTPLDASTAFFTDQLAVSAYRSSAAGYVFGDDESLGGVTPTPFVTLFDGSLPAVSTSTVTATPLLLARMELVADPLGTPGDSIVIDLDTSALASTAFFGAVLPIDIDSVSPVTITIAAVPEPSGFAVTGLLLLAFVAQRRWRNTQSQAA